MEFCQLKNRYTIDRYSIMAEQMFFGNNGQGIGYYHVALEQYDQLLNIIPETHRHHFDIKMMRINTAIPPHTDTGIRSTINFYIETGDAVTQFYRVNTDAPTRHQVANQKDGYIYSESELTATHAFVAEPGDAWLLDVTCPHAVIPAEPFEQRLAVAMGTALDYDQVRELLIQTGEL